MWPFSNKEEEREIDAHCREVEARCNFYSKCVAKEKLMEKLLTKTQLKKLDKEMNKLQKMGLGLYPDRESYILDRLHTADRLFGFDADKELAWVLELTKDLQG